MSNPGKFEGEPDYVEEYWNKALEGLADEDDGQTFTFHLTVDDYGDHRDFRGCSKLELTEDANGFVWSRLS